MTKQFRVYYMMLPLLLMTFSFLCNAQNFEGSHLSITTFPYPMPPYVFENNQMVNVTFKTSPDVLRELVPEPLIINKDSLITVFIGMLNIVKPEPITYYEAAIMIPVSYDDKKGNYMPVLYLDKTLPITVGREIWGFPKFQAEVNMEVKDGIVEASVRRGETTLLDITLHFGDPVSFEPSSKSYIFLMKSIPSAKGEFAHDVRQLTTALLHNRKASKVNPGEAKLSFGSSMSDPLSMIPIVEVTSGFYTIGGFVLDYGEVVYNYLSQ